MYINRGLLSLKIVSLITVTALIFAACTNLPRFGRLPQSERMERIQASPNYRDGQFQNRLPPTPRPSGSRSRIGMIFRFLSRSAENTRPSKPLPTIKTDLKQFDRGEDVLVWMGHSSLFIQLDGLRFLVDPVFIDSAPVFFVNRAFPGTKIYKPEEMPDIDYLLITHDHWDHLDFSTMKKLKSRVGKVICGLGVGEHFERWGFDKERIIEFDWGEDFRLYENYKLHIFPARHFSGRGFVRNQSLWVSYFLEAPTFNMYISGDGGYDIHFKEIGGQFEKIDLAVMENGQYNTTWSDNHLMPERLVQAIKDINPDRVLTVHNSKFTLSPHPWDEPLKKISEAAQEENFNLLTPMIGEVLYLKDSVQTFSRWWEPAAGAHGSRGSPSE